MDSVKEVSCLSASSATRQTLQDKNHELFDDFDTWVKVKDDGVPITNFENDCKRGFREYCYYFAEQMAAPVGQVLSSDCKLFLENVWNQGNMIPVPEFSIKLVPEKTMEIPLIVC